MVTFGVITRVADPSTGGNLATEFDRLYIEVEPRTEENNYGGHYKPLIEIIGLAALNIQAPVFNVGEILILGGDGREIGYPRRKPSKWDVDCEEFDILHNAITRAAKVLMS